MTKYLINCIMALLFILLFSGCSTPKTQNDSISGEKETVAPVNVVTDDMVSVAGGQLKDGVYEISVDSSSSMFRITQCELTVKEGSMTAVMTMSGTGYLKLFMGKGEEALLAAENQYIPFVENVNGEYTFTVPVEALDKGIECAAFSKNKETWYDRTLVFRCDSLPAEAFLERSMTTPKDLGIEDGSYTIEVKLEGGSGKTFVMSPTDIRVEKGQIYATIVWGSANYDYMKVNGEKYDAIILDGHSVVEIPVEGFDTKLAVIADTIAMSTPHEIEYILYFDSSTLKRSQTEVAWNGLKKLGTMELAYAQQFSVDYYEKGYRFITVNGQDKFLVIPEGMTVPEGLLEDVVLIFQPVEQIYLCATAVMNLFVELDALDTISLSGTKEDGWYIGEVREAMKEGRILYGGKYNAPDYERILEQGCQLSIQSQMIYHAPEVKEKLEEVGIPVLVDYSSNENEPLGRTEWIKLYGVLTGREELAQKLYDQQKAAFDKAASGENTEKEVAVFSVGTNGMISVRKPGDYIPRLIVYGGGRYALEDLADDKGSSSTMNIQMEEFYVRAKDADYLIYNGTVYGEVDTVAQLLEKVPLLADFRAVQNGQVWCITKNLYQESLHTGDLALDIHTMLTKEGAANEEFAFMFKME